MNGWRPLSPLETELTAEQQRDQAALAAALEAYDRLNAIEERQQALEQRGQPGS